MRAFVVADAHGNWDAVRNLLIQSRAVIHDVKTGELRKRRNVVLVQVGDLMNCVKEDLERDLECITKSSIFDVLLVGNHEHPYWPGYISGFRGFHFYRQLAEEIEKHTYHAAFEFGGVLVTHAGLSREYEERFKTAREAAVMLNARWRTDPVDDLFNAIGRTRGGLTHYGGILWSDWSEAKSRMFDQLMGHTVGKKIRVRESTTQGTRQMCIDLGAKSPRSSIAGAWIDEKGSITPHVFDPTQERKT